jgi:hypothetical protein
LQHYSKRRTFIASALLLAMSGCDRADESDAQMAARSNELADRFQAELQGRLQIAMQQGGPVAAIETCHVAAPEIAARLSLESGAQVRRIALKPRNPSARAEGQFRVRLQSLATAPVLPDGSPATAQWSSGSGSKAQMHFLRAIPMKDQPCGVCHGTNIAQPVKERIDALYPGDDATGFTQGQLRGAIAISWPMR